MNKALKSTLLAAAISVLMVPAANAEKPAALTPLADVGEGFCLTTADLGGAFLAAWVYENGSTQTKWGGDLSCIVSGFYNGKNDNFSDVEVDIDMAIFEGWTPLPDGGTAWYGCSDDDPYGQGTGLVGECLSAGYGLSAEIVSILNEEFGVGDVEIIVGSCSLGLKAIEPGKEKGPQNYPKETIPCQYISP